ncbi:MAG: 5'-nucleotidase C-terminal domain-containing protein [Oscillospiraceae bacterium]|nr:5'-nucleotidase C-terminal domain-containing protein [Oscillospiraceae bacterium]
MKKHLTKRLLALLLTLAMVLSLIPMTFAEDAPKSDDVVVLFTNDIHCGVDQTDSSIGIAGLAKIKKELEASHDNVVLVDNGDAIQGELIGTVSKGEYLVQLMNYVGYDYAAFGNHEFDYTMPQLKKLVEMANVEYLSCNFRYIGEGENPNAVNLDAYKVVDYDGLKVGFVGITTPESLVKSTPTYFQDEDGNWIYTFCNGGDGQELYDAVQTAVDAARADGAQVVVALAHLGIDEQSSPWMSTEVIANTTGIDVMLDGHSHSTIERQEVANKNGETVLLSSTGTKLAHVGKLTITPEGAVNTELINRSDVDGVDPETQSYLEQIEAEFEELKQQVVAHVDYDLLTTNPDTGARMVRMRETNLGDVCADAYRSVLGTDIAFVNGGGVRANIKAGDVTYEQIINVHPYGNMACAVKASGQEILDALEMSARNVSIDEEGNYVGENGGFLHVSGLRFTIVTGIPSSVVVDESKMFVEVAGARRVKDVEVLQEDGSYAPIDPEGEYTLACHNYLLKDCGDGYTMFKDNEFVLDEVKVDNQVLIEYMTSEEFAAHDYSKWDGEGRITILDDDLIGKTVILHTNDTHGALLGFAQVAKVRKDYEARGARVLLVDAGDFSQGTTYVSTNKGAAAAQIMKLTGYDVVTLGNHEFDFGYDQLKQNLEDAELVTVCADVYMKDTGLSAFAPYTMYNLGGPYDWLKIGFFGMETPETQTKVNPGLITELEFGTNENGKFLSGAQNAIAGLKANGADVIIGLVHLGVDDESVPYRSIDLYEQIKDDVDFLIDGHSHTVMTEGPNGEPIQSTGTKASKTAFMNVGCIVIDNDTKAIVDHYLIPLGEDAPVDEEVAAVAQTIMDAVNAEYGAVFAQSAVELNGDKAPGNRNMETNLGDLITDALRWSVMKDMDAETLGVPEENVVAITNGGGIRAWIHAGNVTKNDINTVLPFGNTVAVVYVTGAELLEALEASTYCTPGAVGGFPQISGMNIEIDTMKSFDEGELYPASTYHQPASIRRVTIKDVNGKAFDPEAKYAVVTNNFCSAGGDTYYAFKAASSQFDTGIPMDEALMEFIKDPAFLNGYISDFYAEPQGRITIKNGFEDVQDPGKYYYAPVYWAYDHEPQITGGKTDTLFGVKAPCTREQIVTFLWKAYGAEQPTNTDNPFTEDVKEGKYYFKAVMWAKEKGITGGVTNTKFGVGKPCTREQAVTFLWKAAGAPEPKLTENPFEDVVPGKYYYKAVLWAFENGVTGGVSETKFGVGKTCTRAQIVTFLYAALAKEHSFEFLVTSDLHGQIFATDYTLPYENSGTYSRGLTRVATYIKEQKDAFGENLYVVDMGDTFQGAPLTYHYAFDKPEEKDPAILAFRTIGYDMWVVGNHEFNYGLDILTRQMDYAVSESTESEKQLTISMANYLKAETNNDETKDWATWRDVAPYVIKDFGGCKVAVIGFGNPNIPKWDVPANWEGIYFANIIETYKHYEAEMLEQADMIVVVAHSGIDSDPGSDFIRELVASTNTIAFAFSGHEHRNSITPVKNTDGKEIPILSPYTKARRIAQVKVEWTGAEEERTITPKLVNMEGYPIDEELAELLQPYETETWENYMLQPIGKALGDYPAANLGTAPSAFMDLINTVQTWGAYDNNGQNTPDKTEDDTPAMLSISAPLTSGDKANLIAEGDIYLGDMFGLYRFENWFYQITMSGEEVHQWLEFAATKIRVDEEGEPYVTNGDLTYYDVIMGDGFHYEIDVSKPEGERVVNMRYQGQPVTPDQVFTVVVNNYRYNGGGNYVKWLNDHGCNFVANDPDRIIYSTQYDMIQGEDEGQARALLVSYIKKETTEHGGITPFITSTWTVRNGAAEEEGVVTSFPSTDNADIEKYGNIFTSLNADELFAAGFTWGDLVTVKFLNQELELPIVPTYSYVDQGTAAVIVGKDGETGEPVGRVKMAINMGNFATAYGLADKITEGSSYHWEAKEGVTFPVPVNISMKEQGGYMAELLLHDINRTNNRDDYPALTDAEFANFRQITTNGMGDHLYRGSSPINPEIGRNTYADAALAEAGVTVIMNLANDQATAEAYPGYAETYYAGQNIIFLNLGVDFQAPDFQEGLANGLRHFASNPGVYYVHCTEGKDRAGFVSALLECFMGATYDEVVADYLKTYTNYYTVVDGTQQPLSEETLNAIADSNIIKTLKTAFEVEDLTTADLAAEAEEYIASLGLNGEEILALRENLAGEYAPPEPQTDPRFEKLTEAPEDWTEGKYLLVYETEEGEGKVFNGVDGANGDSYDAVAIEDGAIAYDEALFTVSFETVEGGYAIHTANGYMGNVGDKNGVTSSSAEALPNTLSFTDGEILLVCNGRYFRFNKNNNNDRFRYFNINSTNDKYPLPAVYVLVNAD